MVGLAHEQPISKQFLIWVLNSHFSETFIDNNVVTFTKTILLLSVCHCSGYSIQHLNFQTYPCIHYFKGESIVCQEVA